MFVGLEIKSSMELRSQSPRFLDEATQHLREGHFAEIENDHNERVRQSYRDAQQALHG